VTTEATTQDEERIPFSCCLDCGSRCELVAVKRGGKLVRIDTPAGRPDTAVLPRLVPCARGRAHRRLLSASERVLHPLRRTGPRGTGEFEEVSWDTALNLVAENLTAIQTEGSTEAVLCGTGAGAAGSPGFSGGGALRRFFSFWGPITGLGGNMSFHSVGLAENWMYGGTVDASDRATLQESRLIVLWGNNPAETHMGPNTEFFIAEARDRGAKVIVIDARYTDSGVLADEWIPIRPGTDVALAAAVAFELEHNEWVDRQFLARCTTGYDAYRDYVLGVSDGVAKTPEWAQDITDVPADTIRSLARDLGTLKPTAILPGWGPQRTLNGEQFPRAMITLACMTGSVGVHGGGAAGLGFRKGAVFPMPGMRSGPHGAGRTLHNATWAADVLSGDLQPPVKMVYAAGTNIVNRSPNTRTNIDALRQCEFVVVNEPYMTPTAREADLVLPIALNLERWEILRSWGHNAHGFMSPPVTEPAGEAKTDYWVFSQLARRLGFFEEYTQGRDEEEWVQHMAAGAGPAAEALLRDGVARLDRELHVGLADFRIDPEAHPLPTPSGRIELVNPAAEEAGVPAIASYEPQPTVPPGCLRLLTPHSRLRANSVLHANAWLQRLEPHALWISAQDAAEREINNGEEVVVRNENGTVVVPAKVTERITPGVVCLYQGTWYEPDETGVDRGGCANTLTGHGLSPSNGIATHSACVTVRRAES
jgi:anaerobic dimethyl sulfoxide reductase subunit A